MKAKLSLDEKVKRDLALNIGELAEASGYSRSALAKIGIVQSKLLGGKMRLSAFWKWVESREKFKHVVVNGEITEGYAAPAPLSGLPSDVDKLRAPRVSRDLQDAYTDRDSSQLHNTELQTSLS